MSDKFDEHEKYRKAKDELIQKPYIQVTELTDKVLFWTSWGTGAIFQAKLLSNTWGKNIYEETDIEQSDIDWTNRIGNKNKARKKGRAIIITFTRHNIRKKVFMNKRKFKWTDISSTESLTSLRIAKLNNARDEYEINKVWKSDGRIIVMEEGSAKPEVIYG